MAQVLGETEVADQYLVATRVDAETLQKIQKAGFQMTWSTAELVRKILAVWDGDPWPLVKAAGSNADKEKVKYQKRRRG